MAHKPYNKFKYVCPQISFLGIQPKPLFAYYISATLVGAELRDCWRQCIKCLNAFPFLQKRPAEARVFDG